MGLKPVLIDKKRTTRLKTFTHFKPQHTFTSIRNVRINIPHHRRRRPQDGIQRIKVPRRQDAKGLGYFCYEVNPSRTARRRSQRRPAVCSLREPATAESSVRVDGS